MGRWNVYLVGLRDAARVGWPSVTRHGHDSGELTCLVPSGRVAWHLFLLWLRPLEETSSHDAISSVSTYLTKGHTFSIPHPLCRTT